jgi:hypothetical protein
MSQSEDEIEIEVVKWTHRRTGKQYFLQRESGKVYDINTQEEIGTYDKVFDAINTVAELAQAEEEKKQEIESKKDMERRRANMKREDEREQERFEEDGLFKFFENRYFLGYKTSKSHRVYDQLLKPFGMYDPKTDTIDKKKKPPVIKGYEDSDEDLDGMIDELDREIAEMDTEEEVSDEDD